MRRRKLFVSSFYGIFLNKDDDDDDDDKEEAFKHFVVVVVYACESDNHKIRINSSRTIVICLPILSRLTFLLLPFPLFFFVPHIILL